MNCFVSNPDPRAFPTAPSRTCLTADRSNMRPKNPFRIESAVSEADLDAKFVQKKGEQYHQALGEKTFYNEQTTWFEPLPESKNSTANDDLRTAIEEYNATADEKYRLNITSCSLNDVLLEIAEAEGKYNAKGRGAVNSPRWVGRSAGDYADAISPWLQLIPSDNGLNFLAAGLNAILNIAKKNAENRHKIIQALHEIPDGMFRTQRQQNIFTDPRLREKAIALYKVLARSLAHLIVTLNPSKSKDGFREHAKQLGRKLIPYHTAAGIDQILEEMKNSVRKFSDYLQFIRDEHIVGTHKNTEDVLAQGSVIQGDTSHIRDEVGHIRQDLRTFVGDFKAGQVEQQKRYRPGVDAQNCFLFFVRSDPPGNSFISTSYASQASHPQPFLSGTELFLVLGVQTNEPIEDMEYVLKHRDQFDMAAQTQAQQLLSSEQFIEWIKSTRPETLLVKGNFQMAGPGRTSALSALCAMFSLNLSKNTNYIVLTTFCGLHEAQVYPNTGPTWLVRSLIAQLLLSGITFDTSFINTRTFAELIKSHDLRHLCSTFRQLIEQLPKEATVVCIIDGLTHFESDTWSADLRDVLFILDQIVRSDYLRPTFKLLLTTPFSKTRFIEDPGTICSHYTVNLLPTGAAGGRRISERGLIPGRSAVEDRARVQGYEENVSGSDDDIFF